MKNKLKSKKGMNAIETVILVIILLMLVIMYVDILQVSQKMSSCTAVSNYISRTLERQGGILNYVPVNFATFGHGSYTTSENAYKLIEESLMKTFGADCIVDPNDPSTENRPVEIKITLVQSDPASTKETNDGIETITFGKDSCFGLYLGGSGTFDKNSPGFISIDSLKYYKPYYMVEVIMKYNLWIIPTVVSEGENYDLEKSFTRIIVPSYYIQEENYDDSDNNNDNFFVV